MADSQQDAKKFQGLMLGDTPVYFDLECPKTQGVMVNPQRIDEAIRFLLRANGIDVSDDFVIRDPS